MAAKSLGHPGYGPGLLVVALNVFQLDLTTLPVPCLEPPGPLMQYPGK